MAAENPKLFEAISEDPRLLLDVKQMFEDHDAKEEEKLRKMQEDKRKQQEEEKIKQRRKYSIPFFWKWANPIFTSVSVSLFYSTGSIDQDSIRLWNSLVSLYHIMRGDSPSCHGSAYDPANDSHQ